MGCVSRTKMGLKPPSAGAMPWEGGRGAPAPASPLGVAPPSSPSMPMPTAPGPAPTTWRPAPVLALPVFAPAEGQAKEFQRVQRSTESGTSPVVTRRALSDRTRGLIGARRPPQGSLLE